MQKTFIAYNQHSAGGVRVNTMVRNWQMYETLREVGNPLEVPKLRLLNIDLPSRYLSCPPVRSVEALTIATTIKLRPSLDFWPHFLPLIFEGKTISRLLGNHDPAVVNEPRSSTTIPLP